MKLRHHHPKCPHGKSDQDKLTMQTTSKVKGVDIGVVGIMAEDMEVNMDFYTTALRAEEPETGFTWDVEGSAAKDPEWREKIATAYEDCHDLAESWPATSLNRRPMTRMFGRQMIFFKCADVSRQTFPPP